MVCWLRFFGAYIQLCFQFFPGISIVAGQHLLFIFNCLPSPLQNSFGHFLSFILYLLGVPMILFSSSPPHTHTHNLGFYHTWTLSLYGSPSLYTELQTHKPACLTTRRSWPKQPGQTHSSASLTSSVLFTTLTHSTGFSHCVLCQVERCFILPFHGLIPPHTAGPPFPRPCWLYAVFFSPTLPYPTPYSLATIYFRVILNVVFSLFLSPLLPLTSFGHHIPCCVC